MPRSPGNSRPITAKIAVPSALGDHLAEIWLKVLLETCYETRMNRGMDGADYGFSMERQFDDFETEEDLSGKTWSPRGPKLGQLVYVVSIMQSVCMRDGNATMKQLLAQTETLSSTLK